MAAIVIVVANPVLHSFNVLHPPLLVEIKVNWPLLFALYHLNPPRVFILVVQFGLEHALRPPSLG